MIPAVVVHAQTVSGLAIVRSLGRKGIPVTALASQRPFLGQFSRYCTRSVPMPDPLADSAGAIAAVTCELDRHVGEAVIFAPTDPALVLLNAHRDHLRPHRLAFPPAEVAQAAGDKATTLQIAREVDVPIPSTWLPEEYQTTADLIAAVTYPCIVKPRQSCFMDRVGRLCSGGRVALARSPDSLASTIAAWQGEPPVVQEFVTGQGYGVYLLADHGRVVIMMAQRRLREGNPRGSGASYAVAEQPSPEVESASRRLIERIGWHGVAMVEFKIGIRPYLMEINGRFWNSLPLSIQAGCDFPYELYRLTLGEFPTAGRLRPGVRSRYLTGDLGHVAHAIMGRPKDWPGPYPSRLRSVAGFLRASLPDVHGFTFAADDPLPGLLELWVEFRRRTGGH